MIDTHAHLNLLKDSSPEQAIQNARSVGLTGMIQVSTDLQTAQFGLELRDRFQDVYPTIGIHPLYQDEYDHKELLEPLLKQHIDEFVAVGEIGLDYHYDVPKELQRPVFEYQMDLAKRYNKPVIIHNRKADEDVKSVLDQYPDLKIVLHCYSSNIQFLESFGRDHLYASFTGMICNQKNGKVIRAVEQWPLSKMMIETDCPYMVPKVYSGQENQPAYVLEVAKRIAELKGVGVDDVIDITTQNAMSFFGLGDC